MIQYDLAYSEYLQTSTTRSLSSLAFGWTALTILDCHSGLQRTRKPWARCPGNSSARNDPVPCNKASIVDPQLDSSSAGNLNSKPFDWNCPRCVDNLVETLDKMILATVPPSNDPVPCNMASIVDPQLDSSSAGNLNQISDENTESTASGHSSKDMGQHLNNRYQSPPKDHGGNKVGNQFPENRFPSNRIRAESSSIETKQNLFQLDHFDDTNPTKNSDLGEFNTLLHTTALQSEGMCVACRIRNGIDSMGEATSMKAATITLWTAWISRLILAMQVPASDCRFQNNGVYTPPITSNHTSTVVCF
jgi:hypothetical protein